MTGLADAYTDDVGALQSPTRLKFGVGLLGAGTVLALAALVAVLVDPADLGVRRIAGVLGGLAAPALVGGVAVVLPASARLRAAAAIGASVTLLGVAGFWHAYPDDWAGYGQDLTGFVTATYFLGLLTIVCCVFAGIATLKRRNDPGGTVSLEVGEGETKVVKVRERVSGGIGGVGLLGGTPDGEVETQTNRSDDAASRTDGGSAGGGARGASARSDRSSASSTGRSASSSSGAFGGAGGSASSGGASSDGFGSSDLGSNDATGGAADSSPGKLDPTTGATPSTSVGAGAGSTNSEVGGEPAASTTAGSADRGAVSDGGASTDDVSSVEPLGDGARSSGPAPADRYCGNCEHFQYVRTDEGMTPYCGLHSEYMDDVEACEDWSSNAGGRSR